ncbi:hypothetical protein [Amycolatopsis sp. NBC_01480]|uniref:hypothetical protein n=1 Tax=Amycolatopsis sp. NBC_01480 TaxID=2903562 RepID=UPI002E287003|nr:hypothetical protein [Amycolatopsis sp. NBC_01480]
MMPTALAGAYSIIGSAAEAYLAALLIGMVANTVLVVGGINGRVNNVLRSRVSIIGDPVFAVGLNVWTTLVL